MAMHLRRGGRRLVLAACLAGAPLCAPAAERHWVGGDGLWEDGARWSAAAGGSGGAGQPVTGDGAFISAVANLIVQRSDQSAPGYVAPGMTNLQIDNAGTNLTTLLMQSAHALYSQEMIVASAGRARVLHLAGSNTIENQLLLGVSAGSRGVYDLSGGTVSAANVFIGGTALARGGLAELNITGGTFTASGIVKNWNDLGGLTVDGGTLNAGALIFNDWYNFHFRKGTINLTGGDGFGAGDMEIGSGASTNVATMNLMAGSFEIDGRVSVGLKSPGVLRQSGGTFAIVWQAGMDVGLGSNGELNVSDGTFTTPELHVGGFAFGPGVRGTVTLTGGAMNVNGLMKVWTAASKVDVNGGTLRATKLDVENGRVNVGEGVLIVGNNTTALPLEIDNGRLDINGRGVIIDFPIALPSPQLELARVRGYLASGYANGAWDGPGIMSSAAAGDSSKAIGYALAGEIPGVVGGSFMGVSGIDASSVLTRFTFKGDTNLDGQVGFVDLLKVAANFGKTNQFWIDGDTNYDQQVGFVDLLATAANFGGALPSSIPGASDEFNAALAHLAAGSLPEPGAGLFIGAAWMAMRRRRRFSRE